MEDAPGSGGKRKRAAGALPSPRHRGRPLSPIERIVQAECGSGEEDLDNFKRHKRYITEVWAKGQPGS